MPTSDVPASRYGPIRATVPSAIVCIYIHTHTLYVKYLTLYYSSCMLVKEGALIVHYVRNGRLAVLLYAPNSSGQHITMVTAN